jgi:aspartate aminotransferase
MSIVTQSTKNLDLVVSNMAENLIGSEIIKLAGDVNDLIKKGERIFNFTIGDFDPNIFPIPTELTNEIIEAYKAGHTNYPAANGIVELRQSVSRFLQKYQGLTYSADEILIAGGARPLIYALYQTVVDKGDKVVFPTPSWNNNHYCHLSGATPIMIEATPENNFMPTAEDIRPHLKGATLLALCSPLNPTGTTFTKEGLATICDLVIEENNNRKAGEKPLYILYDQIYWVLTFGETKHYDPVSLRPELRDYTIYIDGLSKAFAATGVRVGWAFGPQRIMDKMKTILGHVGAWAPKAEQLASAKYMDNDALVNNYLVSFKQNIQDRLEGFYKGFQALKAEGHNVDAIAPQAAIYLTLKIDLAGKKTASGKVLTNTKDVTSYILEEAKLAIVPFYAFGSDTDSCWYRLSVGTCKIEEINEAIAMLRSALVKLS